MFTTQEVIDWGDIEVGEKYRYEEKYYTQAIVEVVEDLSEEGYWRYKLKILEGFMGLTEDDIGTTFTTGRTVEDSYLHQSKFLSMDSHFSYMYQKDIVKYLGE